MPYLICGKGDLEAKIYYRVFGEESANTDSISEPSASNSRKCAAQAPTRHAQRHTRASISLPIATSQDHQSGRRPAMRRHDHGYVSQSLREFARMLRSPQ